MNVTPHFSWHGPWIENVGYSSTNIFLYFHGKIGCTQFGKFHIKFLFFLSSRYKKDKGCIEMTSEHKLQEQE